MVLSYSTGMKGTRVDGAATSVSGEEFRKGRVKVVGDEWGDDILIAVGNDKEMARTNGVKVILPAVEDGVRDITHSKNPKPKFSQSRP